MCSLALSPVSCAGQLSNDYITLEFGQAGHVFERQNTNEIYRHRQRKPTTTRKVNSLFHPTTEMPLNPWITELYPEVFNPLSAFEHSREFYSFKRCFNNNYPRHDPSAVIRHLRPSTSIKDIKASL